MAKLNNLLNITKPRCKKKKMMKGIMKMNNLRLMLMEMYERISVFTDSKLSSDPIYEYYY